MTKDKKFHYENLSYIILICLGFLIVRLFFNSIVSRANVQYQQTIDDYLHHQKQLLSEGNRQDKSISNGLSDFETIEFWAKASKPKNSAIDTWNPDSKNHRSSYQKDATSSSGTTNYFPTAVNVGNIQQQKNFKQIALSHGINEEKAKFKQHLLQKNKVSDLKNDESKTNTIIADEEQLIHTGDIDLRSNFELISPRIDEPLEIKPLNFIQLEELTEYQIDDFKIEDVLFKNDDSPVDKNCINDDQKKSENNQEIKLGSWDPIENDTRCNKTNKEKNKNKKKFILDITPEEFNQLSRERQQNLISQKRKDLENLILAQKQELELKLKKMRGFEEVKSNDIDYFDADGYHTNERVFKERQGNDQKIVNYQVDNQKSGWHFQTEALDDDNDVESDSEVNQAAIVSTANPFDSMRNAITDPPVRYGSKDYMNLYKDVLDMKGLDFVEILDF